QDADPLAQLLVIDLTLLPAVVPLQLGRYRGPDEGVVELLVQRPDLVPGGRSPLWVSELDGLDVFALRGQQEVGLLFHVDAHLLLRQAERGGPEALVRDLPEVVLAEAQVEVGLQALLLLDALEVPEGRLEGPLGGVEVLELELREAAAGEGLDAVVGVEVLPLQ